MTAAELLAASGRFLIGPGLTDPELTAIEAEFGFTFAADHRAFLAAGLPTGRSWPDWRGPDREALRERLAWPVEGVLFDVAENEFWYAGWGPRPPATDQAVTTARGYLLTAPRMIPIFGHRYLPAGLPDHPVLSMYQTDIIYYGVNLTDWLNREFALGDPTTATPQATVAFWRDLL
ncbi:MAG: hypothetical protein ABW046_15570 [Actinoplanes sp.]